MTRNLSILRGKKQKKILRYYCKVGIFMFVQMRRQNNANSNFSRESLTRQSVQGGSGVTRVGDTRDGPPPAPSSDATAGRRRYP